MTHAGLLQILSLFTLGVGLAAVCWLWVSARRAQIANHEAPGTAITQDQRAQNVRVDQANLAQTGRVPLPTGGVSVPPG